ncbi:MAG TPA: ankyrin repeat domain-containing protein [Bryobacteraceae bacterium]|nr:ankyrin repeat domain-containing protein [Bryobacteraceae bacterium]
MPRFVQHIAPFVFLATSIPAFTSEDFFAAARKGDVAILKAHLDKGLDVNKKWRYDQTALMVAASRGHVDAVKLLLDRGADVNIKDSFYGVTVLAAAMGFGSPVEEINSAAIARMLIEKGASGKEQLLTEAARSGKAQVIKAVLPLGPWKPETLTAALVAATANKHQAVEEALKSAGATPPVEVKIDAATLARYAGSYVGDDKTELRLEVNEGSLRAVITGGPVMPLRALDQSTFEPAQYPGSQKIVIVTKGDAVTGFELRAGAKTIGFTRKDAQ